MGVYRNTANIAVYGELGIFPLYIDAIARTFNYWNFIENESPNVLLKDALNCNIVTKLCIHLGIKTGTLLC